MSIYNDPQNFNPKNNKLFRNVIYDSIHDRRLTCGPWIAIKITVDCFLDFLDSQRELPLWTVCLSVIHKFCHRFS